MYPFLNIVFNIWISRFPCRADNAAYLHDGRADKRRYRHDRRADSQCRKNWMQGFGKFYTSFKLSKKLAIFQC